MTALSACLSVCVHVCSEHCWARYTDDYWY